MVWVGRVSVAPPSVRVVTCVSGFSFVWGWLTAHWCGNRCCLAFSPLLYPLPPPPSVFPRPASPWWQTCCYTATDSSEHGSDTVHCESLLSVCDLNVVLVIIHKKCSLDVAVPRGNKNRYLSEYNWSIGAEQQASYCQCIKKRKFSDLKMDLPLLYVNCLSYKTWVWLPVFEWKFFRSVRLWPVVKHLALIKHSSPQERVSQISDKAHDHRAEILTVLGTLISL